jgi:two-component system sensor histidine kinase YesM
MAIVLAVGMTTLAVISRLLSKLMTGDLLKLASTINVAKNGNMDVRADVAGKDEVGLLAANFNEMMANIQRLHAAEREAMLKVLDHQIRPHFLCNALDMIRVTAEADNNQAVADAIAQIMKYFMYNASNVDRYANLNDELKSVVSYIEVFNLIGKKHVEYRISICDELNGRLKQFRILKFILQPIVENAILHGFKDKMEDGFVLLEISSPGAVLMLSVEDNGSGIGEPRLAELKTHLESRTEDGLLMSGSGGIGLKNIHDRLRIHYGDSYSMNIESSLGVGTRVMLSIPFESLQVP